MHSKHSVLNNSTVFLIFYAFLVKSLELLKLQWLYVAVLHVAIVRGTERQTNNKKLTQRKLYTKLNEKKTLTARRYPTSNQH